MNMRVVLATLVVVLGLQYDAAGLVLSHRGTRESVSISLPDAPTPVERHAADELRRYARRITGADICAPVRIGRDAELDEDAFRLCVRNGELLIDGNGRGCLYGVYEILERFGRCGWFSPTTESVPPADELAVPDALDEVQKPAFRMRTTSWRTARDNQRFAAKLRLNGYTRPVLLDELGGEAYGFAKGAGLAHTFNTLLPSEVWFKDHPEYYCERDGRRRGGPESQPCLTNPDVLRIVTSNVLALVRAQPNARVVGVSQNDNHLFCQCAKCRTVDAEEGSACGTLMRFVNAVAEEVEKVRPDVMVQTLIYMYSRKPPKHVRPRQNVMPCLCSFECSRRRPLADRDHPNNAKFMDDLEAWGKLSDKLFIWDYTTDFRNYVYPYPVEHTFQANLKTFRNNHARYIFEEGGSAHGDFAELKTYLLAKWMWNPDLDEKTLLDRFFAGYYGKAAPFMRAYFEKCRACAREQTSKSYYGIFNENPPDWYTSEFVRWTRDLFAQAKAAVRDDPVRLSNVEYAELVPMVVELDRRAVDGKCFFVSRRPESFPSLADMTNDYAQVISLLKRSKTSVGEEPLGKEANFVMLCAGLTWAPCKRATWERMYGGSVDRTPKDRLTIGAEGFFVVSGRHVKREKTADGRDGVVLRHLPSSGGPMSKIFFSNVAFDAEAKYRIRFRARVERDKLDGAAFRAALGPEGAKEITNLGESVLSENACQVIERKTSEVGDGWAWYEFAPMRLKDSFVFSFGSGPWNHGGGIGATKYVDLDCVEIVRQDDACDGEFVIAERGRSDNPPIILSADAAPSFRYAAEELRDHVKGMTDVDLPIAASGAHGVFLEKGDADLGDDGFRIRTGADGVHISGGCRGVLYGVYELLEEYGGCGWYASWRTVMPRRTSFAVPSGLDIVKKPAFLLREPSWCDVRRHADFAVRLRMNGAGSNPKEKHGGAAYRFVKGLPRSHTFDKILPANRYFKDHPEWFSEIGGVRRGGGKRTQICLTNPEALDEAVKNVLAMIAADPNGARVIGVSQNDYREYCRCAKCAAVDAAEGSPAGTLLRFVNALAERVAKVYPDITVETLVYQYTRKPPKLTRPAKNVMPCFCTYEAEIAHPLRESPYVENRNMVPDLEAWSRLTDNLFLWDYTTNWRNFLQPMATVFSLQPNFRYYRDLGVKYSYSEGGEYHSDFAELRAWLIAKLSWDPDADQERLLKRFFAGYYGAAAPQAEACFRKMHELYRAQPKKVQTIWHRDQPEVLTDEYLDWAIAEWERAEAAVKDDPVLLYNVRTSSLSTLATRLNRIAASVKYVWATRDPSSVAEPKEAKALYEKALAIMDEAKANGHPIRIGTGDGFRTERMFAAWKRIFDFQRPASANACGCARFGELTRISQVAKPVDDPSSLTGRAYELSPHSQGTSLFLSAGNVAYDKGVRYRLRVHARADKVPGAKGEALRVRVYHNKNDDRPIEFAQNVEAMADGWAWYDAGTFLPEDSHEISIGGGRFERGGGVSAVKALYVDALEFTALADEGPVRVSERFGFDPKDSTAALQAALDSGLPEIVIDRRASPWVTRPLFVRSNQRIVFEKGVEVVAKRGEFKSPRDRLFALVNVTNVTLVGEDATLRMWAKDYADKKQYEKSEHRHALGLYSCANVTIQGVNLVASGGDGVYIGVSKPANEPCRDITIRSCVCDANRRQGISVISAENLLIEDCVLKNTHGTAPKDGIDFEPNKPFNRFVNCRVRNCTFENNAGYSVEVALQHSDATTVPCDIVVENCRATGDLGALKLRTRVGAGGKPTGRVLVKDCTFSRMGLAPVWTIQNPPGAIDLRFERCAFDGFAPEDAQMPLILQEAPFGADPVPAKPVLSEVCVKGDGGRPECVVDRFGDDSPVVPDFAKATVVDARPGEMSDASPLVIRYHAKFIVYADSPREIVLKVRRRTGKKGTFGFSAGAIPVREEADGTIRFMASARGFYPVEAFYGKDALSLIAANAPVALDCSGAKVFQTRWGRDDVAANFHSEGGTVYLPLPRGQTAELRFAGMAPTQSVAVSVTRPDGTLEFDAASVRFWTRHTVRAEADGLWKVSFSKPASGNLENFRFGIRGVPSLVFLTPERYWYSDSRGDLKVK